MLIDGWLRELLTDGVGFETGSLRMSVSWAEWASSSVNEENRNECNE
jgi:hypothetical protein